MWIGHKHENHYHYSSLNTHHSNRYCICKQCNQPKQWKQMLYRRKKYPKAYVVLMPLSGMLPKFDTVRLILRFSKLQLILYVRTVSANCKAMVGASLKQWQSQGMYHSWIGTNMHFIRTPILYKVPSHVWASLPKPQRTLFYPMALFCRHYLLIPR